MKGRKPHINLRFVRKKAGSDFGSRTPGTPGDRCCRGARASGGPVSISTTRERALAVAGTARGGVGVEWQVGLTLVKSGQGPSAGGGRGSPHPVRFEVRRRTSITMDSASLMGGGVFMGRSDYTRKRGRQAGSSCSALSAPRGCDTPRLYGWLRSAFRPAIVLIPEGLAGKKALRPSGVVRVRIQRSTVSYRQDLGTK